MTPAEQLVAVLGDARPGVAVMVAVLQVLTPVLLLRAGVRWLAGAFR